MAELKNGPQPESDVRRLVEARLAEVEGMATVGMLLEGTIHRINNPLASLLAGLEQLCDRLRHIIPTEEQVESLRIAEEALEQGGRVASAVRELTQLLPSDPPKPVELHDVLLSVLHTLERQFGGRLIVTRKLGAVPTIHAREARLAQVLLASAAVCVDAAQGLEPREPIQLSLETRPSDADVLVRFELLSFEDLSNTVPPKRLEILRGVVQQLGGTLKMETKAVELRLPSESPVYDSEADVSLKRRDSAPPRGDLRILVVDDEPSIHRALERGFKEVGFVQSVKSGRGAIELLEGGATFDVVVSDVIMADGTGIELADWMAKHRPRLKRRLILMTGMGETHSDSHPDVMTVPKPFDLPTLRELVCMVSKRT